MRDSAQLKDVIKAGVADYFQESLHYGISDEEKSRKLDYANRFHTFEPLLVEAHNDPDDNFSIDSIIPFVIFSMENGIDIMKKMGFIKSYIEDLAKKDCSDDLVTSFTSWSYNRESLESKIALMTLKDDYDWGSLVKAIVAKTQSVSYYYIRSEFGRVVNLWASRNRAGFTQFVNGGSVKSLKHDLRQYFAYADCFNGYLDKKQARRYRSECGSVSLSACRGLIEGKDNLSDKLFTECISQFGDSKHYDVVSYLQDNMPVNNINILFANDLANNNVLINRMEEYNSKNKEEESSV